MAFLLPSVDARLRGGSCARRADNFVSHRVNKNRGVVAKGARPGLSVRAQRINAASTPRMVLDLSVENVERVLEDARSELGTLFGTSKENRDIGITGNVELADIDGVTVVLRLTGRFWHKRSDVLLRVANFLTQQIPEIVEVEIEDPAQLDDADK